VSCGSNAFSQLNHVPVSGLGGGGGSGGDLMSSLLRSTILPLPLDGTLWVDAVACGTNISAAIVCHESDLGLDYQKRVCYLWGAGLPGPPLRVPTPLSIMDVKQISCGLTHCGLVTESGLVFTWGAGDQGMLGHGNRQTVMAPKSIVTLTKMKALSISCGAYHTAVIACDPSDQYTKVIHLPISEGNSSRNEIEDRERERSAEEHSFQCGHLYTFGMNKVGQLGHGTSVNSPSGSKISNKDFVVTPKRVTFFDNVGEGCVEYTVAKVSCGMHHTLMLCLPLRDKNGKVSEIVTTSVFCCGWGEHGRLGTGDEEHRGDPSIVEFPAASSSSLKAFCAIDIAAGEQHSLAAGREGAYSWGSNSMGQLGIGSPATVEMALLPVRIPLPEGMEVTQVAAGGRHSAAITRCGKLLSWGWGEEGQLGGGNEKNAVYPRPVRIPALKEEALKGVPIAVAVGMSHTMVLLMNEAYTPPPPRPLPVIDETYEAPPSPPAPFVPAEAGSEANRIELAVMKPATAPLEYISPEPLQILGRKKNGILTDDADRSLSGPPAIATAVRSIRELLQLREGSPRPHAAEEEDLEPDTREEEEPESDTPKSGHFFLTEE
jgi:alpha-tubulin suppressor-like RCC1 family protein